MAEPIRIAKHMAARGVASRREAESMIEEGRVTLNGKVVQTPATFIDPESDDVRLDGNVMPEKPPTVWYLLYKPRGYVTGRRDPDGRKTVDEFVEHLRHRVEPVGRLDLETEGALIFTNDGDTAHRLLHPSTLVPKRYLAKVYRTPDERDLKTIRTGVYLDDGRTAPARVRLLETTGQANAWIEVTVTEGRNRLIRRMMAQLGHPVSKLRRESFGTVSINGMERGQLRPLTPAEIRRIHDLAEGRQPQKAGRVQYKKGFARPKQDTRRKPRKQRPPKGKKPSGRR